MVGCLAGAAWSLEPHRQPVKLNPKIRPEVLAPRIVQVNYPSNSQHFAVTGGVYTLTVRFSADVDRASVVAGQSVRVDFPKLANAPGQITWVNDHEFTWTSVGAIHDLCKFTPDCSFKLSLTDAITAKGGAKLDGDKNGQPGGNFSLVLTLIG